MSWCFHLGIQGYVQVVQMILPAMYHWSPTENRDSILLKGLVPNSKNTIASGSLAYVCLSPTPSGAWSLSAMTGWHECESWDLWQVRLNDTDSVRIRPEFGDVVQEVNVRNVMAPERLWYVGTRLAD